MLPRIILFLAVALVVAGITLHGIGAAEIQRLWDHLITRPSGSLALRFLLQPAMSTAFAIRDGLKDARTGRSPYFWTVVSNAQARRASLRDGVMATGKIILLAMLLDGIYQFIEFKTFFPNEALVVSILLAFVPYLLVRGPVARIARYWHARTGAEIAPGR